MKSLRLFDRRVGFSLGALGILMGTIAPAALPAFASADQISSRSIQMSDSTADASNVTYTVNFTPTQNASDIIIYFCDNSPLVESTCDAAGTLAGFSLAGANTLSSGSLDSASNDAGNPGGTDGNQIAITGLSLTTGSPVTISFAGVHNPTAANTPFFARIETFDTAGHQETSWGVGPTDGSYKDYGGVALSTTDQIGVQAAVLESLQFCTFGDTNNGATGAVANSATYLSGKTDGTGGPTADCGANSLPPPSITLGETISGSTVALSTGTPSYGAGWSQISTNASGGALVYLKDNTTCSGGVGLVLNNGTTCGIPAAGDTVAGGTMSAGTPGFGITFGGGSTPGAFAAPSSGTATGGIDFNSNYTGVYGLTTSTGSSAVDAFNGNSNAIDTQPEDVTSVSGAPVFETDDLTKVGPATNQDVPFGVAASIGANTPAGQYKVNLSLIAVGTF